MVSSLAIYYEQFNLGTQINCPEYYCVSLTIQSNVGHLFAPSSNVKQFHLTHR